MTKVTETELKTWLTTLLKAKAEGSEITQKQQKELQEIGKKQVDLETATVIAQRISEQNQRELLGIIDNTWNYIDLILVLLESEVGITDEQAKKASEKVNKKREEFLQNKQEEFKKQQEDSFEPDKEPDKQEDSEKVVKMTPKND